jgi:hypothetical protein
MQRRIFYILVLTIMGLMSSCELLEQVAETERFTQCQFTLTGVRITEISGVSFENVRSASDLNLGDMMTLGQRIINGSLPAKMEVDVNARNNQSKSAGISGMDWKVFIDDAEFVGGQLNRGVQVLPTRSENFPIVVQVDLLKMLQQESLPKILNMVFGMNDNTQLRELGLSVKIKPSYKTPSGSIKQMPNWITIQP